MRAVLDDADAFCSGHGVGLNDFINRAGRGTTLMSDGAAHDRQREVIGRPLTPKALAELHPEVRKLADALVDRLIEQRSFDAVADLAEVIPATWVPDLLGWPAEGRDGLLSWASDNFDALGPDNDRRRWARRTARHPGRHRGSPPPVPRRPGALRPVRRREALPHPAVDVHEPGCDAIAVWAGP